MTTYSLTIEIDSAGLQTISDAGMSIALLQPQQNAAYQMVAVLTSATNTVDISWTEAELVYVSLYNLSAYSVLQINSSHAAITGQSFSYDGQTISVSGSTTLPGTIQLLNTSGSTVASGLAKDFSVNGHIQATAITSAASLLQNGLGSFEVANKVMLTLLGGAQLGMALPSQTIPNFSQHQIRKRSIPAVSVQPPLMLDFTAGNANQTVHFDDQNSVFVNGGLT